MSVTLREELATASGVVLYRQRASTHALHSRANFGATACGSGPTLPSGQNSRRAGTRFSRAS